MADARPDFDDGAKILSDGVVVVGTTATPLRIAGNLEVNTEYIVYQNLGDAVVWLGGPGVAVDAGKRVARRGAGTFSCIRGTPVYAIVDSGTANVYIAEMGN